MGLTSSWWALLCVPVALLIGFAFAGAGLGATTFMRSFIDFDLVNLFIIPMFLFSGTFFPVSQYPTGAAVGGAVHAALPGGGPRAGAGAGRRGPTLLVHVVYLAVMGPSACGWPPGASTAAALP